jgi:hypothetical protein
MKLAHYLLTCTEPAPGMLLDVTHEEIGNTIGAVHQTVTENLNLMQKQRLVQLKMKHIRVSDKQSLEKILQGPGLLIAFLPLNKAGKLPRAAW